MREGERCRECEYFWTADPSPEAPQGTCQRYPPTNIIGMAKGPDGVERPASAGSTYPVITATNWCGEWKRGKIVKGIKGLSLVSNPGGQN